MLTYLTASFLFLPGSFVTVVILVKRGLRIKDPALEFGDFLKFIGICLLITENPGMNQAAYFSETPIDIFSG